MKKLHITLFIMIVMSAFLVGCTQTATKASYASSFIFEDIQYYPTTETVTKDNLGEQIGEIQKQVIPTPKNNGESNVYPVGTKIYKIKGVDVKDSVAVYFKEIHKAITHETMLKSIQDK